MRISRRARIDDPISLDLLTVGVNFRSVVWRDTEQYLTWTWTSETPFEDDTIRMLYRAFFFVISIVSDLAILLQCPVGSKCCSSSQRCTHYLHFHFLWLNLFLLYFYFESFDVRSSQLHLFGQLKSGRQLSCSDVPAQLGWQMISHSPSSTYFSGWVSSARSAPPTSAVMFTTLLIALFACTLVYWHHILLALPHTPSALRYTRARSNINLFHCCPQERKSSHNSPGPLNLQVVIH